MSGIRSSHTMETSEPKVPFRRTFFGRIVDIDMLSAIRDAIRPQIEAGKTKEDVIASKPTEAFDAKWGKGIFTPDQFVGLVYEDLAGK